MFSRPETTTPSNMGQRHAHGFCAKEERDDTGQEGERRRRRLETGPEDEQGETRDLQENRYT